MSEMEWEDAPEVYVPRVRKWLGPALKDWYRGCYPPRQGVTLVWGWLFILPFMCWLGLKFFIYAWGVAIILVAYLFWVAGELITYRHRRKREALRQYARYMLELYEQDPPQAA